jgi:hypothetical protein
LVRGYLGGEVGTKSRQTDGRESEFNSHSCPSVQRSLCLVQTAVFSIWGIHPYSFAEKPKLIVYRCLHVSFLKAFVEELDLILNTLSTYRRFHGFLRWKLNARNLAIQSHSS